MLYVVVCVRVLPYLLSISLHPHKAIALMDASDVLRALNTVVTKHGGGRPGDYAWVMFTLPPCCMTIFDDGMCLTEDIDGRNATWHDDVAELVCAQGAKGAKGAQGVRKIQVCLPGRDADYMHGIGHWLIGGLPSVSFELWLNHDRHWVSPRIQWLKQPHGDIARSPSTWRAVEGVDSR
jgi:hypothetical protein